MSLFPLDLSSIPLISAADIDAMDLGTAIQLVQGQRAVLLEDLVKDQLKEIQDRNHKIQALNTTISSARELMSQFGEKDGTDKKISDLIEKEKKSIRNTEEWKADNENYRESQVKENGTAIQIQKEKQKSAHAEARNLSEELSLIRNSSENSRKIKEMKENIEKPTREFNQASLEISKLEKIIDLEFNDGETKSGAYLENLKNSAMYANLEIDVKNRGELQTLVENIKSEIDTLSNTQQMDMVRLQNYTNKYNDTFEVRTNMLNKEHEVTSKINNNIR